MGRMMRVVRFLALFLGLVSLAWGAGWPRLEKVVASWNGPRVAWLSTTGIDPVEAPWGLELIEMLTGHGFEVQTEPPGKGEVEGLVIEARVVDDGVAVVARRGSDRAIVGFERHGVRTDPVPASNPAPTRAPSLARAPDDLSPARGGMWAVGGHPVQIAVLSTAPTTGAVEIALMGDGLVEAVRLDEKGPRVSKSWVPPVRPARGLRLDVYDLDGDGVRDLATTWSEDVESLYEGVQSRLHGWILGGTSFMPIGEDRAGYLRVAAGRVWVQKRGEFRPFVDGPAWLRFPPGTVEQELRWPPGRNIYEVTPWGALWAGWAGEGRLAVFGDAGGAVHGPVSSTDFGPRTGPAVSVRLAEPEFRSGFEKEDRVTERWVVLPRRLAVGEDGAVYLVRRGRREGGLLVGRPSGSDGVVRVTRRDADLVTSLPFDDEEAFILDFGLLPGGGVVLLLNDELDGSGQAHIALRRLRE